MYDRSERRGMTFIDGNRCPECDATMRTDDGMDYECPDCGATFDGADLFYV